MNLNLSALSAFVGVVALAAAATWWMLSDEAVWPGEIPTCSGKPVQRLIAVLPAIGDFDHEFNVNDDNPFLPLKVRQREIALKRMQRLQPHSKEPTHPVVVTEVVIPTLQLPAAAPRRKNAPECFGVIGSERGLMVLARMPGSQETHQLEVGQSLSETEDTKRVWTFIGLDSPNMARFQDPNGDEQIFRVGPSLTSKSADAAPSPQKPKQLSPGPTAPPMTPPGPQNLPKSPNGPKGAWRTQPGAQPPHDRTRPPNWTPRPSERPMDESGNPVQPPGQTPPPVMPTR